MKALLFAGGAALLSILACSAPTAAADPLVLSDVSWVEQRPEFRRLAPLFRGGRSGARAENAGAGQFHRDT